MRTIDFCINSKIELIKIVEEAVEFFLKNQCGIDKDSRYWFLVGFHEILINAYLHGNKKDETLPIKVSISFQGKILECAVSDKGSGFNPREVPDPTKPENILKPSGRGLLFANKSCDRVFFDKKDGEFIVRIIKKVKEVPNA